MTDDRMSRALDAIVCARAYRVSDPDRARMYRMVARTMLTIPEQEAMS